MFGRRSTRDGDIVDAAQRRLAALAAHHEWASGDQPVGIRGQDSGADVPESIVVSPVSYVSPISYVSPVSEPTDGRRTPDVPAGGGDPVESDRAEGRHVGPRRSWFELPRPRQNGRARTELGRWGITAQHVTVTVLCLVALVVGVAWWSLRSVPHAESVPVSSGRLVPTGSLIQSPLTGAASLPSTPTGSTATAPRPPLTGRVVVDVAGKVTHPGIVELPAGSRVVDAIDAAGGPRAGVVLTSLNLARVLVDGEQIVVGVDVPVVGGSPPPGGAASSTPSVTPVNLNTATAEQLDTLPGVGPVTAQAILQWRSDNGAFTSIDDLLEVSGIGAATLSDLRPYVYV